MNEQKYFPKGLYFKEPHSNAPDFVKGQVSIKVEEFKSYLSKVKGEYLNIDLKVSKDGKAYAEVNTFKPEPKGTAEPSFNDDSDPLPF